MSSRFGRSGAIALALLAAAAGLAGCSLYEGPPPQKKKEIGQGRLGCLKDFRARLIAYTEGASSREEVIRLADCSISAMQTFGELARGENKDRFSAQEVRNFLQRYFLEDVTITDELLREMMRVKQALVGGQVTEFTQADLKFAETLISTVRDVLVRLQPTMPLTIDRIEREGPAYVEEVARALVDAGDILGRKIVEQNSTYTFDEMQRLCDEIIRAFKSTASSVGGVRDRLKLAGLLKEMVIAPYRPRETISADDWKLIFQDGSRWAGNLIKFRNLGARYPDWTRGEGRERLSVIVHESFDLTERAIARHCPVDQLDARGCRIVPGVPIDALAGMLDELDWDGSLGKAKFDKSTLKRILPPFVRRFLGGTDLTETGRKADRLTHAHLTRMRGIFREWVDGARYVEGAYAALAKTSVFAGHLGARSDALLALDPRTVLRANGGVTEAAVDVAEGLRATIAASVPLLEGKSRGVVFDGKNLERYRVYRETARYAWMRPVLKRAVLGYLSGDRMLQRASNYERDGLTLPEFREMIEDYWQILLDFNYASKKNLPERDARKRFREAALFTRVSDGNALVSIDEGMQLLQFMLSADPLTIEAHDRMETVCRTGEKDDFGQPRIEPECYRRKFYDFTRANAATADLWKPFPLLIDAYEGMDAEDREDFVKYLEMASRKIGYTDQTWYSSDDTQATVMIFHYMESLFLRFDANRDGAIDQDEGEAAFPIFQNTLAEFAGRDPGDSKLESVFVYLLANGEPPVSESMSGWNSFWRGLGFITMWHWFDRDFEADRLSIVKVFSALGATPVKPNEAVRP